MDGVFLFINLSSTYKYWNSWILFDPKIFYCKQWIELWSMRLNTLPHRQQVGYSNNPFKHGLLNKKLLIQFIHTTNPPQRMRRENITSTWHTCKLTAFAMLLIIIIIINSMQGYLKNICISRKKTDLVGWTDKIMDSCILFP